MSSAATAPFTLIGDPSTDPSAIRKTFSGFSTRLSGGGNVETRGRFLIERDHHQPLARIQNNNHHFAEFVRQDRLRQRKRKRLIEMLPYRLSVNGWDHLGRPEIRHYPKVEPMMMKGSAPSRAVEFPVTQQQHQQPPSDSAVVFTKKAITTLLNNTIRKRSPDPLCNLRRQQQVFLYHVDVLNCILLAVIDERELRACLILHVAFGLALPPFIKVEPGMKIPDLIGSLSSGLLKKKSHYPLVNRIFLMALDKGLDSICLMIGEAGFPKSFDDPIYSFSTKKTTRLSSSILPSYLILAVTLGRSIVVRMMLTRGASPGGCWLGLTPLLLAPCGGHPKASTVITRILLENGADPNVAISEKSLRRLEKLATICKMEVDPDAVPLSYAQVQLVYPLDIASTMRNCDAVILLLSSMSNGGVRQCRTCLLTHQNLDITVRLLKMRADVDQRDAEGNTPLHLASRFGKTDIVAVLLHSGANLNAVNDTGWTPLHEAAFRGYGETMQYLMSKGADARKENQSGDTPVQLALSHGIHTDDLLEYFHKNPSGRDLRGEIQELITQVDAFQMDEAPKKKRRFLIEKLLPRWLSTMTIRDGSGTPPQEDHNK